MCVCVCGGGEGVGPHVCVCLGRCVIMCEVCGSYSVLNTLSGKKISSK